MTTPLDPRSAAASLVSCVVRFHTPSNLDELSIALLSIAGQTHSFVEPIVVLQDFSDSDEVAVRDVCTSIPWPTTFAPYQVVNLRGLGPGDHRSDLANAGIASRSGRFLAFLDYDDLLYDACYSTLLRRLADSGKVIAFGGVVASDGERTPFGRYCFAKWHLFRDRNKYDFFADNQYPVHSFVLDTARVEDSLLRFQSGQCRHEDYAFLLRILARYDWDIGATGVPLAEYTMHVDGSNTILAHSEQDLEKTRAWKKADDQINSLRAELQVTIPCLDLVEIVQEGRIHGHGARIRELSEYLARAEERVREFEGSTSWRITAPVRFIGDLLKRATRVLRRW